MTTSIGYKRQSQPKLKGGKGRSAASKARKGYGAARSNYGKFRK